ncbi:MAG: ACT domain-containing protein, partial [Cutibacterium granulosum]
MLRIQVPDVPGALGKVATTMGTVDADISAVEIVEKGDGYAIDDFIL